MQYENGIHGALGRRRSAANDPDDSVVCFRAHTSLADRKVKFAVMPVAARPYLVEVQE